MKLQGINATLSRMYILNNSAIEMVPLEFLQIDRGKFNITNLFEVLFTLIALFHAMSI